MKSFYEGLITGILYGAGIVALMYSLVACISAAEAEPSTLEHHCEYFVDVDEHLAGAGYSPLATLVSHGSWVLTVYGNTVSGRWIIIREMPGGCAAAVDLGEAWFRPGGAGTY